VAALAGRRWAGALRIVAYHRVTDAAAFDRQLAWLAGAYRPVGEEAVRAALGGERPLPERAVWVTFDDGDPTVVDAGLEVLARHRVPATLYVCPGLVEAQAPPWWEVVLAAGRAGVGAQVDGRALIGGELVTALKRVPDPRRREAVAELAPAAEPELADRVAVTRSDLGRWLDAGHAVGNHTWDHPCLDRCSPDEQRDQIVRGHRWVADLLGGAIPTFAYPNGDRTDHAQGVLADLGCDVALLFDHALARVPGDGLNLSRLRLDADAPVGRARAVVSGAHSALFGRLG
jgi:peptidoglycan/xylan/chitin deacetylase (PgdA/CDA1 family)